MLLTKHFFGEVKNNWIITMTTELESLLNEAKQLESQGKYDESLQIYDKLCDLTQDTNGYHDRCVDYDRCIVLLYRQLIGNLFDKLSVAKKENENAISIRDELIRRTKTLAGILHGQCRYNEALKLYDDLIILHNEMGVHKDNSAIAHIIQLTGNILYDQEIYKKALELYNVALKMFLQEHNQHHILVKNLRIDQEKCRSAYKRVCMIDKYSQYVQHLSQLDKLNELLVFSKEVFNGQQHYLAQRIQELLDLCAEDEEVVASASSLKSMLLFLLKLNKFNVPSIAISEDGLFCLNWKKGDFHIITLQFRSDYIDYVVFLPSQESNRPIVLNGKIGILDFHQLFVEQISAIRNLIVVN